jgi:hypothetical protein
LTDRTAKQQKSHLFQKGQSGNPRGRPPGARNKATRAAEALLDGEAESLTRACVSAALGGDTTALRLCLERILPPRRDRPIDFTLSPISTAADACVALSEIVEAVSAGHLTPTEATAIAGLVDVFVKSLETRDLESRVLALEARATPQ